MPNSAEKLPGTNNQQSNNNHSSVNKASSSSSSSSLQVVSTAAEAGKEALTGNKSMTKGPLVVFQQHKQGNPLPPPPPTMLDSVFATLTSSSNNNNYYNKQHQGRLPGFASLGQQDVLEMNATEEELRQAANDAQSGDSFSASEDYDDDEGFEHPGGDKRAGGDGGGREAGGASGPKRIGFIETLFNMVHSPENAPAIGFAADGIALEIRNTSFFSNNVLPRYFKHRNVSSFIRQLNNYQFRTIPSNKGIFQTFVHDCFQMNRKDLINQIKRRTGIVVKKKKTLFEQVSELKQRELDHRHRVDELEMSDMQKSLYINDLEAHLRVVKDERDALVAENQRLMLMLSTKELQMYSGGGSGGGGARVPPPPQQHGPPPPPPHHPLHHSHHHQQQQHQPWMTSQVSSSSNATPAGSSSMFEPVSGPSRFEPLASSSSSGASHLQQQPQLFESSHFDWMQRPPNNNNNL